MSLDFSPLFEDVFVEECELMRSDLLENELDVEGAYVSEEHMRTVYKWNE